MKFLIIIGVVFVALLIFKKKIENYLKAKIAKKRGVKKEIQKSDDSEFVFIPVGMTRSFNIGFTIEEVGGGKAKITINGKKNNEVEILETPTRDLSHLGFEEEEKKECEKCKIIGRECDECFLKTKNKWAKISPRRLGVKSI